MITPHEQLLARIAELERRLEQLEHNAADVAWAGTVVTRLDIIEQAGNNLIDKLHEQGVLR